MQISIDGHASTGKSFLATEIAKRYNITYIYSGAFYRAVGIIAVENNIDLQDEKSILKVLKKYSIDQKFIDGKTITYINGEDYTTKFTTLVASNAAAVVSRLPNVRIYVNKRIGEIGTSKSVVAERSDTATHILPKADIKFFIESDYNVRLMRRLAQLQVTNKNITKEDIEKDFSVRDKNAMVEFNDVLKLKDIIIVKNTNLSQEELLKNVFGIIDFQIKEKKLKI